MSVGKIGGKKGAGAARGAGMARGTGVAPKATGAAFRAGIEPIAPAVRLGDVGAIVSVSDPVIAQAAEIVRQFREGAIKTKEEATRRLVANILREIVRTNSKTLTNKIAEDIEGDPRLQETLEKIWAKAE
ncbi:MAG: hypothetical protein FWG75_07310 [Cystobacterineae bacterium]|nr:hypothetical protein [Cystobacterineae bacterium]